MRRRRTVTTDAVQTNELVVVGIAGPETAERLGIPVGAEFDARHVVTAVDGSRSSAEIVSVEDAVAIRERIARGEEA